MGMRSLDFGAPKHVVKSVFYEILICMGVCVCEERQTENLKEMRCMAVLAGGII